jgi:hypothetical protein
MAQKTLPKGAESERLVIGSTGSIASGKSTYLSALHASLGYDNAGIKIEKETIRGRSNKERDREGNKRMDEGFFRSSATINPDRLDVYGLAGDKVYGFDFLAPGGHHKAAKLGYDIDGLLYFLDLNLTLDLKSLDKSRTIDFGEGDWPLIIEHGNVQQSIANLIHEAYNLDTWPSNYDGVVEQVKRKCGITDDVRTLEDLGRILKGRVKKMPPFGSTLKDLDWRDDKEGRDIRKRSLLYKHRELLGDVIKSVIDSYIYAAAVSSQGTPVIGVGTHKNSAYGKLPKEEKELLRTVESIYGKAIDLFAQYCKECGIGLEAPSLDLEDGIKKDMEWFFTDMIKKIPKYVRKNKKYYEGYFRDVINPRNDDVIEIAYNIMDKAMRYRSLDRGDLKLLTFSDRSSGLTIPYRTL